MKKALYIILSAAALALLLSYGFVVSNPVGWLKVKDGKIIDADGRKVVLRGFNVQFRFFRSALGERDIERIARSGANCVRLVLDYRDFESAPFLYNEENFSLLDTVLNWCEKDKVYAILDMHLAPGAQNPHDFVVHRGKTYEFWSDSAYRKRFYSLWAEIAGRYAPRKMIAGYDLLNEGVPPSAEDYAEVMGGVLGSIRSRDRGRVVIMEEAILPNGKREFLQLRDPNVVYSVHFFYPEQLAFYVTTTDRAVMTYPGEMITAGERIGETRSMPISGNNPWRQLKISAVPPKGAELLVVDISSRENRGKVWIDDLALELDGHEIDLPAPGVRNNSFETDYPGISWDVTGRAYVTEETSHAGKRSVSFSSGDSSSSVLSSPLKVRRGEYRLSAWYKSSGAAGDTHISLSWHRKKTLAYVDRKSLVERLDYAIRFSNTHNVPLYIGEFACHANPDTGSVANYLNDLIDIMDRAGVHWSFWEYYSEYDGVGLYTDSGRVANRAALDVLWRRLNP